MGFLVDDEGTALMWRGLILTKALEQFLTDVRWGEMDYLLIDMPPGTGDIQMGLARMLPQAEMLVVTTPARRGAEGRGARRRHGPALLHEGRRRGREHERARARPTARATRCSVAAVATRSRRRSARRSSPGSRSSRRCRKAATPARRSCSARPTARPAIAFREPRRPHRRRAAPADRDERLHRAHLRAHRPGRGGRRRVQARVGRPGLSAHCRAGRYLTVNSWWISLCSRPVVVGVADDHVVARLQVELDVARCRPAAMAATPPSSAAGGVARRTVPDLEELVEVGVGLARTSWSPS